MTRITFILESLCELNNPRAINAYHFIDQLAKTHSEVKIITSYDERVEFSFNSKNILIYRPLNGLKFFESLNLYPLLINGDIDVLHVFAPFTKSKWNYMRNLKFAASFLKIVRNCKTSFSGYDPSFHNWSIKAIQKFNENFDLIFSHFHDQLPQSLSQPLIVPIIKDADPTIESNKNISIIANFSQILDEPELLKTLEDFLSKNKDWKVQICGGWGELGLLSKSSQQVFWQNTQQLEQWIIEELDPLSKARLVIDLSKTLSDSLYFAQQCLYKNIPYVSKVPILKHIKDRDLYLAKLLWPINNYEGSLYEKLLILKDFSLPQNEEFLSNKMDFATNNFNRATQSLR